MKGFSAHLVIFAVVVIVGFGLFYPLIKDNSSDVKGTSVNEENTGGMSIAIISRNTSWDLFQYLCKDEDECTKSADSGKRISKLSGDITDSKTIRIRPIPEWEDYSFLKLYVRPGWDVSSNGLNVSSKGDVPGTLVYDFSNGNAKQTVLIVPTYPMLNQFFQSATFTD